MGPLFKLPRISLWMVWIALLSACSGKTAVRGDYMAGQKASVFILTWPDYEGSSEKRSSATWVLDGKSLGKGHVGYEHLLERMKAFPVGSTLKVQFTPYDGMGGGEGYSVPLKGSEYLRIAEKRHIKVEFPPFGAGWQ